MIRLIRLSSVASYSVSLLAVLLFVGCNQDMVTITYDQVGACNGYDRTQGPGAPKLSANAGPKAAFVAFRIVSLDNSKSSIPFNFDPHKLFINQTTRRYADPNLSLNQDLGWLAVVPVTVPAGKLQGNDGITAIIASTTDPNGAHEANNTSYFLNYDTAAGDPIVVLVKNNPSQTTWPQILDCTTLKF